MAFRGPRKSVIPSSRNATEGVPYRRRLLFGRPVWHPKAKAVPLLGPPAGSFGNHLPGNVFRKCRPFPTVPPVSHPCFPKSPRLTESHRLSKTVIRRDCVTSPDCGAENGSGQIALSKLLLGFNEQERHTRPVVTRSVSEGKRWPSLAYASGYDVVGKRTITQVVRQNSFRERRSSNSGAPPKNVPGRSIHVDRMSSRGTSLVLDLAGGAERMLPDRGPRSAEPAPSSAGRPPAPDRPADIAAAPATASKAGPKQPRIREGTALVQQAGVFQTAGDRVTFLTSDGQRRFVVLENLQLERISRAVGDSLTPPQWTVSGMVTEFCGANYLFVDRAVLRATVPPGQQGRRPWADPQATSLPHSPPAPASASLPAVPPVKP